MRLGGAANTYEDTVCRICPNGTFSVITSAHHNCSEHRSCNAAGLVQTEPTTSEKSFLLSSSTRKCPSRRLRRIVNHLNRADGHVRHNLSDLHVQINSWVASATPEQIRQLPDILMKAGANGAAERLQNKLQRIDSNLQTLGNEVEVALRTRLTIDRLQ
ncbi:hypothetical protein L3Q82_003230 [Scortum barcoo]|uniref:Uncharacterized protein n=1 Tax=Scortum barcoo TaxID=214431 RepID=A0ACB8VRC8_9TELE|nr:hypothetical protein L3Q82_003230 [Scortum barcoo]